MERWDEKKLERLCLATMEGCMNPANMRLYLRDHVTPLPRASLGVYTTTHLPIYTRWSWCARCARCSWWTDHSPTWWWLMR